MTDEEKLEKRIHKLEQLLQKTMMQNAESAKQIRHLKNQVQSLTQRVTALERR